MKQWVFIPGLVLAVTSSASFAGSDQHSVRDWLDDGEGSVSEFVARYQALPKSEAGDESIGSDQQQSTSSTTARATKVSDLMGNREFVVNDFVARYEDSEPKATQGFPKKLPKIPKYMKQDSVAANGPPKVSTPVNRTPELALSAAKPIPPKPLIKPQVKPRVASPAPQESSLKQLLAAGNQTLTIRADADKPYSLSPARLSLADIGDKVSVVFVGFQDQALRETSLFVRDEQYLVWDDKKQVLTAAKLGKTELYVFQKGHMSIVPIEIGSLDENDFSIPPELVALDKPYKAEHAALRSSQDGKIGLAQSEAEVARTLERARQASSRFAREGEIAGWKNLTIQMIDDRSVPAESIIYPVVGAQIKVVGTSFVMTTNGTGHVSLKDVPIGARFMVQATDPAGRYMPTYTEVYAGSDEGNEVVRVKMIREPIFQAYGLVLQRAQDMQLASFCGQAMNREHQALSGVNVRLSVAADGPLYFGNYGPDRNGTVTSANGRFCFLNVSPGLTQVDFYRNQEYLGTFTMPLVGGAHLEEEFPLSAGSELRTYLTVAPTAHEQIYGTSGEEAPLRTVDSVDLLVIGDSDPMEYFDSGIMGLSEGANFYRGRLYGLSRAAEFEQVLYSYDEDSDDSVTTLIPRGFVEDLYTSLVQAQDNVPIAYDESLGTLLVDFGHPASLGGKNVAVKVVDSIGRELDSGWYYGDSPDVTKAVFFNLQPGIYTVMVASDTDQWLAMQTIAVDFETTSLVRLGRQFKNNSPQQRAVASTQVMPSLVDDSRSEADLPIEESPAIESSDMSQNTL